MNIFFLHEDPRVAAQMHCDKHLVKMIVETAQLLSTAHRVLDGTPKTITWQDTLYDTNAGVHRTRNRKKKLLLLPGESASVKLESIECTVHDELVTETIGRVVIKNQKCYNATHANHPSNVWCRETGANYDWLTLLFGELLVEYTQRYGKIHQTAKLLQFLQQRPSALVNGKFSQPTQAMPDIYKVEGDSVEAYRKYYLGEKARFARWTNREVPTWFLEHFKGQYDEPHFARTKSLD